MFFPVLIVFSPLACQAILFNPAPIVKTSWGYIEGIHTQDDDGNKLEAYLGIPFALPPVGNLRFKKPEAHPGSKTTFKAYALSPPCIQVVLDSNVTMVGEEDCLFLNVYVPAKKSLSPRAVMVWIYGGGFFVGDLKNYNPSAIVTLTDVIVVTIQYRLGPMGFLSTMDDACRGNFGLWDQILGLKWVKENIAGFGGHPGQVTVFGESAGAASIGLLTISPVATGLFQRAILQSGSPTSSSVIQRDVKTTNSIIAERVSCHERNSHQLINCLRKVPAEALVKNSYPATDNPLSLITGVPYGPVVDGEIVIDLPRKTLSNLGALQSSAFPKCDVMISVNNNERENIYDSAVATDLSYNTSLASKIFDLKFFKSHILPMALDEYLGSHNMNMEEVTAFEYQYPDPGKITPQTVIDIRNDVSFFVPGVEYARAHAAFNNGGRTYFYYFNHDIEGIPELHKTGMMHAYDLLFTLGFNKEIMSAFGIKSDILASEERLSRTVRGFLAEFAKTGDPSPAVKPDVPTWPQYDLHTQQYLNLDDNLTIGDHLLDRRVSLWLDLLPKLQD